MAKKKKYTPKLKLVKDDPNDITIDDITHAIDKIIMKDDSWICDVMANMEIAENMGVRPEAEKEEFEIVVNHNSDQLLYDAVPLDELLIDCPNLKGEGCVWVVSVQAINKESNSPYDILATTKEQEGALNICQGHIYELFESYPLGKDETDILVKREYVILNTGAKFNVKIEFHVKQYQTIYRACSQLLYSSVFN